MQSRRAQRQRSTIQKHVENMTRKIRREVAEHDDSCASSKKIEDVKAEDEEEAKDAKTRNLAFLKKVNEGSMSSFENKRLSTLSSLLSSELSDTRALTIHYQHYRFTASGVKASLAPSLPKTMISYLDLSNHVLGLGVGALARVLPQTRIETLKLFHTGINNTLVECLANALTRSRVRSLDLGFNMIGDSGCGALAAALPHTRITDLNLGWNVIRNGGAREISKSFASFRVTHLVLSYNHIGAYGLRDLSEKIPGSTITTLWIGGNKNIKMDFAKKYRHVSALRFECP